MAAVINGNHKRKLPLKFTAKLLVLTLVCLGISSLMSGNKVYADQGQCPRGTYQGGMTDANANLHWGVPSPETGPHGGNMAGVVIEAIDGSSNTPINTHYHINSSVTGGSYKSTVNGQQVDLNAKIFQDDNENLTNRVESYQSNTDDVMGNNGQTQCTGWDAFGPHDDNEPFVGNGHVLDCIDSASGLHTRFWFTDLANPTGVPSGDEQGYWEVQVYTPAPTTNGNIDVPHYTEGSMNFNGNYFTVANGSNTFVYLIWHPTPTKTPSAQSGGGQCTTASATNESTYYGSNKRVEVKVLGVSSGRVVRTAANGLNANGPTTDTSLNPPEGPDPPMDDFVPNPSGENNSDGTPKANNKYITSATWYYQPVADVINITITTEVYNYSGHPGWWAPNGVGDIQGGAGGQNIDCFTANCNNPLTVSGDGDGTGDNIVIANGSIYVSGTYTNTGPLTIWNPALIGSDGNTYAVAVDGSTVGPGGTVPFNIVMPAPGYNPSAPYSFSLTPEYFGSGSIGNACSATVPVYQHFTITPTVPTFAPGTNPENPYEADGKTHGFTYTVGGSLTEGSTTTATTTGSLTDQSVGGAPVTVDSHSPTDSYGTVSHTYNYDDSSFQPGDQFCPHVDINPASGFHGPAGYADIDDHDAASDGSCVTIVNEPYFKAYGGGISASNGVTPTSTTCAANANNSGILAGWNDNADAGGAERGSGSELSALALIKITGVASAQTDINRSPTDLTFANNNSGDITSSVDSPSLGGNFGGSPTCGTVPKINATSTLGGTSGVPANTGSYKTSGDLTLTGGTVNTGGATSIQVNGNLYITGNTTYGASPSWTFSKGAFTGPSLVIVATGNIYIAPGVTQLDGMYYAQPTDATTGGSIYTCTPSMAPPPATYDFYNNCNNQLLVNGSFVADNVKLERSFGSLRNEEPSEAVANVNVTKNGANYDAGTCYQPGATPNSENSCFNIGNSVTDLENYTANYTLNLGSARTNYKLDINYSNYDNPGTPNWPPTGTGFQYLVSVSIDGTRVQYAYLPVSASSLDDTINNLSLAAGNHTVTVSILNNGGYIAYGSNPNAYDSNFQTNSVTLSSPGTPITAPKTPACSNKGTQMVTGTCAAEVFQFSPEIYLQNTATEDNSNGAIQYDAITSLPPIL